MRRPRAGWAEGAWAARISRIPAENAVRRGFGTVGEKGLTAMRTTDRAPTPSDPTPETNASSALLSATRGSVMVEYLTLTAVVALVIAAAAVMLGAPLIHLFHYEQTLLLLPVP